MSPQTTVRWTRRGLLAASLGVGGAAVASAVRPLAARAANGETVLVGGTYDATGATTISRANAVNFLDATIKGTTTVGSGVMGSATTRIGVYGYSTSGQGVVGETASGYGVIGQSNEQVGVLATSFAPDEAAAIGQSLGDSTGCLGFSGSAPWATTPPAKTGVYGYAAQDASSRGVYGRSVAGRGVYGQAQSGQGVRGYSATGVAVYASTSDPMKGAALRAVGRIRLDNCAGTALIGTGAATSGPISPGIELSSTTAVTATLMGNAGGSVAVKRVAVDTAANAFTIVLTGPSSAEVRVAWHCFG